MCGVMLFCCGVDLRGFYPFCSGFRMRVSAAPFAGHAGGGPPAAAHVREAELRGGHLGHAAKADDLQLKVGRPLRQAGLRKERMGGLGKWPGQEFQAALNWHTVKLIKEKYNIPLVLKGIATAEDTRIAVDRCSERSPRRSLPRARSAGRSVGS